MANNEKDLESNILKYRALDALTNNIMYHEKHVVSVGPVEDDFMSDEVGATDYEPAIDVQGVKAVEEDVLGLDDDDLDMEEQAEISDFVEKMKNDNTKRMTLTHVNKIYFLPERKK